MKLSLLFKISGVILVVNGISMLATPGMAIAANGRIYVTNEKSSTITVLNGKSYKVVRSFKTCKRPRGVHFSKDRKQFYVLRSKSQWHGEVWSGT